MQGTWPRCRPSNGVFSSSLVAWCEQCGVTVAAQVALPLATDDEQARAMVRAFALTAFEAASETLRSLGIEHLR